MRGFRAGGHRPAHAMPPPERPKLTGTRFRRKPKQLAAPDRVPTSNALAARRTVATVRQWFVARNHAPQIPDVADMLVVRETVWDRGARTARSPAFAAAAAAYLICAWVVVGATASPPAADDGSSTAHDADASPRAVTPGIAGRSGNTIASRGTEEPRGDVPVDQIDPQFFASLQTVLNNVDDRIPGYARPAPLPYQAGPPVLNAALPDASVIAPPPEAVADPNGLVPAVDPLVPAAPVIPLVPAAPVIAPPPGAVVNPNGQTAEAPASVPLAPVIAPTAPTVVNPSGPPPDASNPPLGPLPGPAG